MVSNTIVFRNKYILYEYVAEDGYFLDIYWVCCLYSSPSNTLMNEIRRKRSPARNHFENNNEDGFNSSIVQRAEAFINVQSSTGF